MNVLEKIICYIGGADIDVLKTCPIDKQKFMVLGIGVLNTSILSVIVKTCSDSLFSIGQKNCQLFVAKLRNFLDSHNRMVLY